jgi:type 1 glutamine amidotransferase
MRNLFALLVAVIAAWSLSSAPAGAADQAGKIKALIITGDDVPVHNWKETTAAVRKILLDSGRFDVTVSEDLKPLDSAEELKQYDVIMLNRCDRKTKLSGEAKKNLLDFVHGGKGLYVEHLASASFANWPEFGNLCGRYWVMGKGKSGHGPRGPFDVKIADDKHPITAGLKDFHTDDELYAKLEGKEPIHVLVEAYSDWSKKTEPLVFWLPYGEGRVVYCTLGHDGRAISTPEVTTLIRRSIEWAATGKAAK